MAATYEIPMDLPEGCTEAKVELDRNDGAYTLSITTTNPTRRWTTESVYIAGVEASGIHDDPDEEAVVAANELLDGGHLSEVAPLSSLARRALKSVLETRWPEMELSAYRT